MSSNIFLANEYQVLAARTINAKLTDEEKVRHALFEMAGELGEVHSVFQKQMQGHEINETHLKEELGDLMWGIAELCTAKGWKLSEVLAQNIEKLTKRYPEGFSEYRSVHREV